MVGVACDGEAECFKFWSMLSGRMGWFEVFCCLYQSLQTKIAVIATAMMPRVLIVGTSAI